MNFLDRLALLIEKGEETEVERVSRRVWLANMGAVSATSAVVWACGKKEDKAKGGCFAKVDAVVDGGLLNSALALEHEAISIYTQATALSIMTTLGGNAPTVLAIATSFLEHHTEHRDTLISTIEDLQKTNPKVADPVEASEDTDYLSAEVAAKLTTVQEVLRLAASKEMSAAQAYFGLISKFTDAELARVSGMLGGEEAGHYGVLRAVLLALYADPKITKAGLVIPASLPSEWEATEVGA